ncbi:MAG: flagellar basal body-associated FliL family protein [Gammaproteobacteria bacterium]|nr:flagellar basal body-associated FliL family protein [Gammaproteobacteria bacterium]MDH5802650.1 flagellar basal body-associated FliL family protein [Gammaproteobacteria bacterium]
MADDAEDTKASGGVSIKLVLLIVVVFLISGLGAGMYLAGAFSGSKDQDEAVEAEPVAKPAIYIPIDPPFVVNFTGDKGAKFLQVTLEFMTRQVEVPGLVSMHMPAIRNNLILLFSNQSYQTVSSPEGKDELRAQVLQVVQDILQQESGDIGVEAVYFTSFVMQ